MTGGGQPSTSAPGLPERVILDAVHVAVVATDLTGCIFYCNAAAEDLYGYERDQLLGGNVADLLVGEQDQAAGAEIMSIVMSGRSWSGVFPVRRADGTGVPVRITDSPLFRDGAVVGIVGVAEDVSALQDALAGERAARDRLARLTTVALELAAAQTLEDLTRIVVDRGLPVLGSAGGAVSVRDDVAGVVRLAISDDVGHELRSAYAELPLDSPLPAARVARTGETVLLPTRASALAWSPETREAFIASDRGAWAHLPLHADGRLLGALVVSWLEERAFPPWELRLLEAFAAQTAQALDRILTAEQQRQAALESQRLSEALQLSLLTRPPQPEHMQLAVRYRPAVASVSVGGDWWDGFGTADGATILVVGDVNGHDRDAAAAMGQVRNLLRGLAYDSRDSPAVLLSRLDAAIRGLRLDTLATVFVGRVERAATGGGPASIRLRWSSAGHLPAVLRSPDGTVRLLEAEADLMLGVDPGTDRTERVVDLPAGSTLLACTDGLVERRGASLDDGLAWLAGTLAEHGDLDPEAMCDLLLALTAGSAQDDDVALLVMRV